MIAVVWIVGALLCGRLLVSAARAALMGVCAIIVILALAAGTVGINWNHCGECNAQSALPQTYAPGGVK